MLAWLKRLFDKKQLDTGQWGEMQAARYLKREKGFKILEANWRAGRDEVDLIARDGDVLVFVEVKTRKAGSLVSGYYAVDQRKRRALQRAMRVYLKQLSAKPQTWRMDVVEVNYASRQQFEVLHFAQVAELDGFKNGKVL